MGGTMTVGVVTTLVGLGVVVLILLILFFTKRAHNRIDKPKQPNRVAPKKPITATSIDLKTIAAITAAIVVVTGTPAANLKFTAIKRLGNAQLPWAAASNADIMDKRERFT